MIGPGLVVAGASAARDAGRSRVILAKRQGEVRDCPLVRMALARDFLWASIFLELLAAQTRPDAREQQPLDA
jgi:hypothetical protein